MCIISCTLKAQILCSNHNSVANTHRNNVVGVFATCMSPQFKLGIGGKIHFKPSYFLTNVNRIAWPFLIIQCFHSQFTKCLKTLTICLDYLVNWGWKHCNPKTNSIRVYFGCHQTIIQHLILYTIHYRLE